MKKSIPARIEKSPFLFSTLLYNKVAYYLQPNGTAGSAQDNLSPDDIKQISIVLPAKELINDYNLKFKNLIKVIVCNWAQIRLLKKFNSTILNAYFTSKSGESSSDKLSFILLFTQSDQPEVTSDQPGKIGPHYNPCVYWGLGYTRPAKIFLFR